MGGLDNKPRFPVLKKLVIMPLMGCSLMRVRLARLLLRVHRQHQNHDHHNQYSSFPASTSLDSGSKSKRMNNSLILGSYLCSGCVISVRPFVHLKRWRVGVEHQNVKFSKISISRRQPHENRSSATTFKCKYSITYMLIRPTDYCYF